MTVLVDTGVLYAEYDDDATRHEAAAEALEAVYEGRLGQPLVSDYVYDESVTLALKRTGSHEAAATLGARIRGDRSFPDTYEMHYVTPAVFDDATTLFERYHDQGLSFTDVTSVALCERHKIDTVLSFDDDFDGVVDRTDPGSL